MSTLDSPSVVINPAAFTLTQDDPGPQIVPLYALAGIYNERIESVWMQLPYGSATPLDEIYSVQLLAPNQDVVWEGACPPITKADSSNLLVTLVWSRAGGDTSNEAMLIVDDMVSGFSLGFANVRLPDLVLAPLSSVQLLAYRGSTGAEDDVVVSNASVTTTRNAGAVSTTQDVTFPAPYLIPSSG